MYSIAVLFSYSIYSQDLNNYSLFINKIYDEALSNGKSYERLDYLSNQIGGRLSGSVNYERSVKWGKEELNLIGLDSICAYSGAPLTHFGVITG